MLCQSKVSEKHIRDRVGSNYNRGSTPHMSEFDKEKLDANRTVPMVIQVDSRERDLYLLFLQRVLMSDFNGLVKVVSTQLPIGDIIVNTMGDDGIMTERVIIERKTPADLASSIRDGRYAEQSFRLNGCDTHNHNIVYLIEGDIYRYTPPFKRHNSTKRANITTASLVSAIHGLNFYKGFNVVQVPDMGRTCDYILGVARKIGRETRNGRKLFYTNDSRVKVSPTTTYTDVHTSRVKKSNITVQNISEIMLAQIPGVSASIAKHIISQYGSMDCLLQAIRTNPDCLSGMVRVNKSGKATKIPKTSLENIGVFLIGKNETSTLT